MAATFTQKAASVAQSCDGAFGFSDGTSDYIVGGWGGGTTTYKTFWKSTDLGASFTSQSDFTYAFHTGQTCIVNGVAYLVGGDYYNVTNEGDWRRSSHKCESGVWSQIASNPGIANRVLGCLVYLGSDFYLIGGQAEFNKTGTIYNTVLRSSDGLQTFTEVLADTKTQGFMGGLTWGSCVVYKNLIWKICGGVYTDVTLMAREFDRSIFSSPDGINWTYRGKFCGHGRHYHQCVVHNDKIYLFGGFNSAVRGTGYESPGNLSDYWTIELLSSGKMVQTYKGLCDWGSRHAQTMWANSSGIMFFGGSGGSGGGGKADCWLFTE